MNQNSGAESTIHGLLTMLALDAHPETARIARSATVREVVGPQTFEAEDATLSAGASPVRLENRWTGEASYSGTGYASLGDGSTATFDLGRHPAGLVLPVVELRPGSGAVTTVATGSRRLGSVRAGAVGAQGDSPAPGALLPLTLSKVLPAGDDAVTATTTARRGDATRLDALMFQPLISRLVLGGDDHGTALLRSAASTTLRQRVTVPGEGTAHVWSYDGRGALLSHRTSTATTVPVAVSPGGFTLVRR